MSNQNEDVEISHEESLHYSKGGVIYWQIQAAETQAELLRVRESVARCRAQVAEAKTELLKQKLLRDCTPQP